MVIRLALAAVFLASCNAYSPDLADCKVHCGPSNTCPAGRECKQGWCRPPNTTTSCECNAGDVRACGGGMGECKPGTQTCTIGGSWGQCLGETKSTPEVCDNKDNDCNGQKDDLVTDAPMCPKTVGVCVGIRQQCVNGAYSGTCADADYGNDYQPVETRCDNKDNDCDGFVDGKPPTQLLPSVGDFMLAEYDGGFSIVGVQQDPAADGGSATDYQLILVRLDAELNRLGPNIPIGPSQQVRYDFGARTSPEGSTFVVNGTRDIDAGYTLTMVDRDGGVRVIADVPDTERTGPLTIGASAAKVTVAWPAHFGQVGRVTTFVLDGGQPSTRDIGRLPDGGFNTLSSYFDARLSPTGRVLTIFGTNVDAGTSLQQLTTELDGTRTSTSGVSSSSLMVEVGPLTQAAWITSFAGINLGGFVIPASSTLTFKNDVFSAAAAVDVKAYANDDIKSGAVGRGQNSAALMWIEKNVTAVLATPIGNGQQSRTRFFPTDGGTLGDLQLGHPGGPSQLIGVVWRSTLSGPGQLDGTMTCQP